ncbi:MAG TPA: efflux RND transporter periplasmic adaptor subunit [Thermoanaerobaculia bacterium]|nr:efflux RND transporter periplasmic adaptor subunit [Thermoanaerobaculia bacterium]
MRARTSASVCLLLLACPVLLAGCSGAGARAESRREAELTAHRGTFRQRLILSGELAAERGEAMNVPRTNAFQLTIRWLAPDGVPVKAGDPVVAFDNSQFSSDLEEKRLSASQAGSDLATAEAQVRTSASEQRFDVQKARSALEKAKLDAAIPKDLLALREYQERQLALKRAETDLAKAEEVLRSESKVSATDVEVKKISLDKSKREIHTAEEAIDALNLKAPRDGMVIVGSHPFEGRKYQVGDSVWPGMAVATLPDLSSMMVQANLSDVDDGRIRPGMQVVCTLDAYPDTPYRGRVVDISPVARESRRSPLLHYFPVRIALEKVDTRRMRPGMSVRVEVLGEETKDALLVPREALDLSAGGPRVLLAAGGSAPVRLGPCSADTCVVESGVSAGTRLRSRDGRAG